MSDALDRRKAAQQNDATARGTFLAGTRVLDLVTGLEGVVVERTFANSGPFGMVPIRLDRGDTINRYRAQLLVRPTPPTV